MNDHTKSLGEENATSPLPLLTDEVPPSDPVDTGSHIQEQQTLQQPPKPIVHQPEPKISHGNVKFISEENVASSFPLRMDEVPSDLDTCTAGFLDSSAEQPLKLLQLPHHIVQQGDSTEDVQAMHHHQPDDTREPCLPTTLKIIASRCAVIGYLIMSPMKLFKSMMYGVLDLGYFNLLIFFTVIFYTITLLFCLLIYIVESASHNECVRVGVGYLEDLTTGGQIFSGLFAISWTTLSTVGYGNTWPALSTDEEAEREIVYCPGINLLLMVEAFVGVCFAGTCGAILFKKVVEIQSQAQVTFSEPVVIRFGSGLTMEEDKNVNEEDISDDEDDQGEGRLSNVPCPCLEFRIVNLLHNYAAGVITDASLHCTVSVEEELDVDDLDPSSSSSRKKEKVKRVQLPKKIFLDLGIVNDEHPHFKRVWTVFHILNENSPLLTTRLRNRIRNNHGLWPNQKKKHNEAQYIANNLCFEEIIVSLNGISRHTSCEVNAQKVYGACDVVIGYKFVPILEKEGDDVLVLMDSINDVTEQNGNDKALPLQIDPMPDE